MGSSEEMDARYASGEAYQYKLPWDRLRHQEIMRVNELHVTTAAQGQRVKLLDLGCGAGVSLPRMISQSDYVAADVSGVALQRLREQYPEVTTVQMDMEGVWPFEDGTFDVILMQESIEHIHDGMAALLEANRVASPHGFLVLSTPNRDSLHLRIAEKMGQSPFTCSFDHLHEYGYEELRLRLKETGWHPIQEQGIFLMPYWGISAFGPDIRRLTDEDEEVLLWLRDMGRQVHPRYAFGLGFLCEKKE